MEIQLAIISDEKKGRLFIINYVLSIDQFLCMQGVVKEIILPVSGDQLVGAIRTACERGTTVTSETARELSRLRSPIEEYLGEKNWSGVYNCRKLVVIAVEEDAIKISPTLKTASVGFQHLSPMITCIKKPEDVLSKLMSAIERSTTYAVTESRKATIGLPRRISWIAVKGANPKLLAEDIFDAGYQGMACKEGLDIACNDFFGRKAVIMPSVKGWTIVAAFQAFTDYYSDMNAILMDLSVKYHRVQAFAQDTVVEYYQWLQAVDGKMNRVFVYHGEAGGLVRQSGRMTKIEIDLKTQIDSGELEPDENSVGTISDAWSLNPFIPRWKDDHHVYMGELSK